MIYSFMLTSSSGDIFRVTGPLSGEFTGPGEFPAQWPVTRSFDVFFDLRLNKGLSKQPRGWWFETPPWSLWRQCNVVSGNIAHLGIREFFVTTMTTFTPPKNSISQGKVGIKDKCFRLFTVTDTWYDVVITWGRIPHCWPFVRWITGGFFHKGTLVWMFSWFLAWRADEEAIEMLVISDIMTLV